MTLIKADPSVPVLDEKTTGRGNLPGNHEASPRRPHESETHRETNSPPHHVGRSARSAGWRESSLSHLGKRHLRLFSEVAVIQPGHTLERVDLIHRLVVADAHDARKAKRETAQ